jgi:hypothetical protein
MIVNKPYLWWDNKIHNYSLKALTREVIATKRAKATKQPITLVEGYGVILNIRDFNE